LKRVVLIFFLLIGFWASGQKSGYINLREKKVQVLQPEIRIDTFSIQPFYFEVFIDRKALPPADYIVDFVEAILYLNDFEKYLGEELTIKYLVYPAYLRRTYQKYTQAGDAQDSIRRIPVENDEPTTSPRPLDGLQTQGSITRAINAGNQQSLVMISGLDLKIEGKLSKNVRLKAVLSDDNLPQAYAGISQSYKEFDRIYMQLSAPDWTATAGDLLLNEKENYFLKFTRKTQGLSLNYRRRQSSMQVTGAYVEGRFAINRFQGVEGNQGPYALKGNEGEPYIFVIPQSEKVYVNGQLLQSGENHDYIIDYETAELRFNPSFSINQNQRIVVEFNYSNQQYVRYLNYNKYSRAGEKFEWTLSTFTEGDVKTQTLLYDLTEQQVEILKNAGDDPKKLWVLAAVPSIYDEHKILYKKIENGEDFYFEYSPEEQADLYEVKFSYVGKNQGDYRIAEVVATGKIYEYVGENNGDYIPYIKLTPPQNKKYIGFVAVYTPGEKTYLKLNTLLNHTDKNLFSSLDNTNDTGGALHLDWRQGIWQKGNKSLKVNLLYDFVCQNFEALDPYRSPEFNRLWQVDTVYGKQHLLDFNLLYQVKNSSLQSGYRYFSMRDSIQTGQFFANLSINRKKWQSHTQIDVTGRNAEAQLSAVNFNQLLNYHLPHHDLTAEVRFENRDQSQAGRLDSLNYQYQYAGIKYAKTDTLRWAYELSYRREMNDSVVDNRWQNVQVMDNLGIRLKQRYQTGQWQIFGLYRHSQYKKYDSVKDYLNLQATWRQSYFNKLINSSLKIESFNGNTLRDEVVFVETPPGQGVYEWHDYNGNGIKEINEFEVAVFSDQANYIRVVLPSKNYVPTLNNNFSATLNFNFGIWQKRHFLRHIFGVIRYQSKNEVPQDDHSFFSFSSGDESLSQQKLYQQDWFYNRAQDKYHVHFIYQNIEQKQLLLVGAQAHRVARYELQTKHRLGGVVWKQKFSSEETDHQSENYTQKNYLLQTQSVEEGLLWRFDKQKHFYVFGNYREKENLSGDEYLQMYKAGVNYFLQTSHQNSLHLDLEYIDNMMQGDAYSPVAFQMLEGLQTGKNVVFKMMFQKKLNSYLDLNWHYNFRIAENHAAIHTGGVQLKMIF